MKYFLRKSGEMGSVDWGTVLPGLNGRDIGKHFSQSSCKRGRNSNPIFFHIFFLIASIQEDLLHI
jgi:hypothetical protein